MRDCQDLLLVCIDVVVREQVIDVILGQERPNFFYLAVSKLTNASQFVIQGFFRDAQEVCARLLGNAS